MSCTVDHGSNDSVTLCFECGRDRRANRRASTVDAAADAPLQPDRAPLALALTDQQIAHRRAMLEFAQRGRN